MMEEQQEAILEALRELHADGEDRIFSRGVFTRIVENDDVEVAAPQPSAIGRHFRNNPDLGPVTVEKVDQVGASIVWEFTWKEE